jgi:hypothetical protein
MQEAALRLAYGEYDDLGPRERIAILRGLSALALGSDGVRDHISARLEAFNAAAAAAAAEAEAAAALARRKAWLLCPFYGCLSSLIPCMHAGCRCSQGYHACKHLRSSK